MKASTCLLWQVPHAFLVRGRGGVLLLGAADDALRDGWVTKIRGVVRSFWLHPHTPKGKVDLKTASHVRKTTAPRAPEHSFDIVCSSPDRIYTLSPPSKEAQLRWVTAISRAIRVAAQSSKSAAGATPRQGPHVVP